MKHLVTSSQLPILGGDPKLKFLVDISIEEHSAMKLRDSVFLQPASLIYYNFTKLFQNCEPDSALEKPTKIYVVSAKSQ